MSLLFGIKHLYRAEFCGLEFCHKSDYIEHNIHEMIHNSRNETDCSEFWHTIKDKNNSENIEEIKGIITFILKFDCYW
jgi:hypothetical protein